MAGRSSDLPWGTFLFRPIGGGILLFALLSVIYNIYAVVIKKGKASLEEIE